MALATWPSLVPFEQVAEGSGPGQSYLPPIASETEGGPALLRPRPGPRATEMPWRSVLLTAEQWQAFEQFCRETLVQGTLPFSMPVFRPGEGHVARACQIKNGIFTTDTSDPPWYSVAFTLIVYNW